MPENPKVKRAYNAKPVLKSTTFSPFSTFAFAGGEFLGEDPLQAYLTAKLELARAEHGIFPSLSPAMQSLHMRLSQRLERTRHRYERLVGVLRTNPQASQVQKVISELGIAVPVGASQQELFRYVRWERDRLFREISRLEQRLRQIKTSVAGANVPLADFLKDLEYFVEEFERSGYFQTTLPKLLMVNKSNEAVVDLVNQAIERIADLQDAQEQQKRLEELRKFLTGESSKYTVRTVPIGIQKRWDDYALMLTKLPPGEPSPGIDVLVGPLRYRQVYEPTKDSLEPIVEARARELHRLEYQIKPQWELREAEIEEQRLLDRVRGKKTRRPAGTYERVVFSVDRILAAERPDTLRGVPDLESYVGRFLYARDSRGGRRPLEVIGIDRSGAEPSLIVRPVSPVHGREAQLKVLTTPYSFIRYYETHLFPEAVARKWSVATKMDPYSSEPAATSIFHEISERLERSSRHLEQVAREIIDDAKYRQTVVSFIRDPQVHVYARPWVQVISELLGMRFSVSSSRLGMKTSFRIPYRMFLALERDFPFLMYSKDMDEVVQNIVATTWTNLVENRRLQRQVERILVRIRNNPSQEQELTQRLTEFIDNQIAKHLHKARGRVFSELLGNVAVEELGEAARYVAPLQYLIRALEERGVPESQHERYITEILSRYRQDPSSVPKALRPLVEGNDWEIFEILRAMSSGRAKSPLSLNLPIDDEGKLTLADTVADTVADESVDWGRIDTKLAIEEEALAGRPQVQRAWIPPDLKGKHRNIFLRLMASYELSEEIESAGSNLAERFLSVASGIMGRELSPEEQERLLAGGWQELIRMAKAENVPRPYVVPSLQAAEEYERLGLIRPGNLLLEHQGRLVAARITGPYEEGTAGLQLLIPSTSAEIVLSPTEQAGTQFLIPASQLSRYEKAAVHPIFGGNLAWAAGREASLRPPVHPRLLAEMGYSVADVLKGAAVLRSGGIVGAVDIETTGLPEHYRLLGLDDRFYPTEIGIAQFSIRGQDLKPIRSRRMIIRPSQDMEEWVRGMAALSEAEFVSRYAKSGERAAVEAARQVYHQTLRGYAALVQGPGIRWATDVSEEEIRSLALQGLERAKRSGVYLSTAMKHYQAMVEDIGQRMGHAHIIAANAARAEAQWLARWMPEAPAPVVYHDPQALFRLLYPNEHQYNLSHIASRLGIKVSTAQVHTSLYDARLAAKAYVQLAQDQRLGTLINNLDERFFLRSGQILARIQGGARNLYRVEDIILPTGGEQGRVVLRQLLGRPRWMEIAGASMGEIEQRLFGQFLPVAEGLEEGIGVLLQEGELGIARAFATREEAKRLLSIEADYWADRARRDLLKAFNPASDLFQLFLLRPGSPEFAEALERLTPAYASGLAGRAPGKTGIGREVYQRTIREFLSSTEGALHRRFFTQVGQMIEAGIMDRQEAAFLGKTYYNKLREMLEPRHRLPLRSSRFFLEVPGLGRRSVPLSSPEATRRQVERIIWQLAEEKAGLLPAREYFPLALRELRTSLGELVPEEAGIDEIAQAVYREGRRLWQEGKLLMPDPARGFLPETNRAEAIRRIWQLQNELLADRRQALEILSRRPSAVFIGDLPAEDAFAIAEGLAMPIRPPKSTEQFEALRRSVWRDITEAAFNPTGGRAHELASQFLGLGQGDLGRIRLPFPVSGEYGVPLGQVTMEQWPEVKRWLRRGSGLHMDMRSRIMEFWAQRFGERQRRRQQAGAVAALAQSGRRAAPGARGWMWAGVAGAAALGLYAIGSVNMSRVQAPEPVPQTPPAQGLEIQIQATRTQPADLSPTVQAATMAIQNALGLPLNVTVHQIDDTRTMDQRWAQEVVAQALRG